MGGGAGLGQKLKNQNSLKEKGTAEEGSKGKKEKGEQHRKWRRRRKQKTEKE